MKRKEVIQITNLNWIPKLLKTLVSEFLSWFVIKVNATKPFIPVIEEMCKQTGSKKIITVDMNLGAGPETVKPFLSDELSFYRLPMASFNTEQDGVYLFVNSFHQFPISRAKNILREIYESNNPVVIVEGNNDSLWQVFGMVIIVPLTVQLTAPFVRPFRFSRIIFTYFIPILPLVITIDGFLALFKLYTPQDFEELVVDLKGYEWKTGRNDNGRGGKIIYLTGKNYETNSPI